MDFVEQVTSTSLLLLKSTCSIESHNSEDEVKAIRSALQISPFLFEAYFELRDEVFDE